MMGFWDSSAIKAPGCLWRAGCMLSPDLELHGVGGRAGVVVGHSRPIEWRPSLSHKYLNGLRVKGTHPEIL